MGFLRRAVAMAVDEERSIDFDAVQPGRVKSTGITNNEIREGIMDKLRLLELLKDLSQWVDDEDFLKVRVEAEIKAIEKYLDGALCSQQQLS